MFKCVFILVLCEDRPGFGIPEDPVPNFWHSEVPDQVLLRLGHTTKNIMIKFVPKFKPTILYLQISRDKVKRLSNCYCFTDPQN